MKMIKNVCIRFFTLAVGAASQPLFPRPLVRPNGSFRGLPQKANSLQPALPKDWPDGSVSGLKTRGGFRVSIAWKSGELISATIQSTTGRETKVRYRDQITPVTLKPGDTFRLK